MAPILLDENLPASLTRLLEGSRHVSNVGLSGCRNAEIWAYAQENQLIIATKDTDYLDFVTLTPNGQVILLKVGNLRLSELNNFVLNSILAIEEFARGEDRVLFLAQHD